MLAKDFKLMKIDNDDMRSKGPIGEKVDGRCESEWEDKSDRVLQQVTKLRVDKFIAEGDVAHKGDIEDMGGSKGNECGTNHLCMLEKSKSY